MTTASLCIIQARYGSTRLPGKMLLELGGDTLIARAWRLACAAFGRENCVVAIPRADDDGPLGEELRRIHAHVFLWDGAENDVLGRFWACAHLNLWHPDAVVFRWTPDDPFKHIASCRRVASGERLPVELAGEAFTLAMLDAAQSREPHGDHDWQPVLGSAPPSNPRREHITDALFPFRVPVMPGDGWTVDTAADYTAAIARELASRPPLTDGGVLTAPVPTP